MAVTGTLIGGPTLFFFNVKSSTYRADITGLNLISPGPNTPEVKDLNFDYANNGAGILVIYDDGINSNDIQLKDGNDLAYFDFSPTLDTTVEQSFSFSPVNHDRTASLAMFFSSVNGTISGFGFRPSAINITISGITTSIIDQLDSTDGEEWDTLEIPVNIPAGATSLKVQAVSIDLPGGESGRPASFAWNAAALSVPKEKPCGKCEGKVTKLNLKYNDGTSNAHVQVYEGKDPKPDKIVFDGTVNPGQTFQFDGTGVGKDITLSTEISIFVNGVLNTKIHTSCSQPIGPGLVRGDFEVIAGESKKGGPLCPLGNGGPDACTSGFKPQAITMKYTNTNCDTTNPVGTCNAQQVDKWSAETLVLAATDPAYIRATDKDNKFNYFAGNVNIGDNFIIDAGSGKILTTETFIKIYSDSNMGELRQEVKIHTSCSQPLLITDPPQQFGYLDLMDLVIVPKP